MENNNFIKQKDEQSKFYQAIGDKIKIGRKSILLTQEDLAFVLNFSWVAINNIENGKQRLPIHLLSAISAILNIPISELIPKYDYGIKAMSELKEHKVKTAIEKL